MKIKEVKKEIGDLLNGELWFNEEESISDFADTKEELEKWLGELDYSVTMDLPEKIKKLKLRTYGVSCDDGDYVAFMVVDKNKKVFGYGYNGD